jgi:hypothetical protein
VSRCSEYISHPRVDCSREDVAIKSHVSWLREEELAKVPRNALKTTLYYSAPARLLDGTTPNVSSAVYPQSASHNASACSMQERISATICQTNRRRISDDLCTGGASHIALKKLSLCWL